MAEALAGQLGRFFLDLCQADPDDLYEAAP
jgi:hypothetical protein